MSVKIGILSDGSAIHFDHRNLFSNLASLNTAIRTTALTELVSFPCTPDNTKIC